MRIRFAGFGGQGIVLCGVVFGEAAMNDGKNAVQTQSYGSASRGGLTRSDVRIEAGAIYDLVTEELDVLVALSQQSYDHFAPQLLPSGQMFYDVDLVRPGEVQAAGSHGLPTTELAHREFGRKIVANMIMMGFVNGMLGIVSDDSLIATIRENVPPGTEELNERAYRGGLDLALQEKA